MRRHMAGYNRNEECLKWLQVHILGAYMRSLQKRGVFTTSVSTIVMEKLDSEGCRVAVKYYFDDWPSNSAKESFDKSVFTKTQKTNARTEERRQTRPLASLMGSMKRFSMKQFSMI